MPYTSTRYGSSAGHSSSPRGYADYGSYSQALRLTNKAFLASTAMANVAVLSEMADTYSAISPGSARRCNLLADVYTAVAARMIEDY